MIGSQHCEPRIKVNNSGVAQKAEVMVVKPTSKATTKLTAT